jgi:hypothetical protein
VSKREYQLTIPIAGHAYVTVEAESEEEALDKAMGEITIDMIETWEPLEAFNQGNVCYCPQPWRATVEDMGEVEP